MASFAASAASRRVVLPSGRASLKRPDACDLFARHRPLSSRPGGGLIEAAASWPRGGGFPKFVLPSGRASLGRARRPAPGGRLEALPNWPTVRRRPLAAVVLEGDRPNVRCPLAGGPRREALGNVRGKLGNPAGAKACTRSGGGGAVTGPSTTGVRPRSSVLESGRPNVRVLPPGPACRRSVRANGAGVRAEGSGGVLYAGTASRSFR